MISSKKELREYLKADKESLGIQRKRPKLFRDEIWRFEIALSEYYGAAEPPVRCGESHLSGLTEPPHFVY